VSCLQTPRPTRLISAVGHGPPLLRRVPRARSPLAATELAWRITVDLLVNGALELPGVPPQPDGEGWEETRVRLRLRPLATDRESRTQVVPRHPTGYASRVDDLVPGRAADLRRVRPSLLMATLWCLSWPPTFLVAPACGLAGVLEKVGHGSGPASTGLLWLSHLRLTGVDTGGRSTPAIVRALPFAFAYAMCGMLRGSRSKQRVSRTGKRGLRSWWTRPRTTITSEEPWFIRLHGDRSEGTSPVCCAPSVRHAHDKGHRGYAQARVELGNDSTTPRPATPSVSGEPSFANISPASQRSLESRPRRYGPPRPGL